MKVGIFNSIIGQRVIKHVNAFGLKHKLFDQNSSILLALSGGIDSVFCLKLFYNLLKIGAIKNLRCIHINHGTRVSQIAEEKFVTDQCLKLSVDLTVVRIQSGELSAINFENNARKLRYKHFHHELKAEEILMLAHHIDDSFEWSLMQQFRSGNLHAQIGIPVRNKKIIRPLMCLTKNHIKNICKQEFITYMEDPTNSDENFERNYVRNFIKKSIQPKYPKYLKNYVHRSNELVRQLSQNISPVNFLIKKINNYTWTIVDATFVGDFTGVKKEIREIIHDLSKNNRGKINSQIDVLLEAIINKKSGPIFFSGKVRAQLDGHLLIFTNAEQKNCEVINFHQNYTQLDLDQFKKLLITKYKFEDISRPILVAVKKMNFFGRDLVSKKSLVATHNLPDSNDQVIDYASSLVDKWQNKKNLTKRSLNIAIF